LLEGLSAAMGLFHAWYGQRYRPIPIECDRYGQGDLPGASVPRAAIFLSGGVDSLAVLKTNHRRLPPDHPGRFRDGILIHGHDMGGIKTMGGEEEAFERARENLRGISQECDLSLIPVRTNTRRLCDDHEFWMRVFYSAALAAVGHALSSRIDRLSISSANVIRHLRPWGSHPMLDPCYSSGALQVRHTGLHQRRLDRVRIISQWPTALGILRVCGHNPLDHLNCGNCEKCVRTMTQLAALGVLDQTDVFPEKKMRARSIRKQLLLHDYQLAPYLDALPLLANRQRHDLVRAIRRKHLIYKFFYRFLERIDLKYALKKMDRVLFGGCLLDYFRKRRDANQPGGRSW